MEPEMLDLGPTALSLSQRTFTQNFYVLKKSIDISRENNNNNNNSMAYGKERFNATFT